MQNRGIDRTVIKWIAMITMLIDLGEHAAEQHRSQSQRRLLHGGQHRTACTGLMMRHPTHANAVEGADNK